MTSNAPQLDEHACIDGIVQIGNIYGVAVKYNPDLRFIARQVKAIENANSRQLSHPYVVLKYHDNGLSSLVRCYNQAEAEKGAVRYAVDAPDLQTDGRGWSNLVQYKFRLGISSAIYVMPTDWIIFAERSSAVFVVSDFDFQNHMRVINPDLASLIDLQREKRTEIEVSNHAQDRLYMGDPLTW